MTPPAASVLLVLSICAWAGAFGGRVQELDNRNSGIVLEQEMRVSSPINPDWIPDAKTCQEARRFLEIAQAGSPLSTPEENRRRLDAAREMVRRLCREDRSDSDAGTRADIGETDDRAS